MVAEYSAGGCWALRGAGRRTNFLLDAKIDAIERDPRRAL
jgi:hypothetical protein